MNFKISHNLILLLIIVCLGGYLRSFQALRNAPLFGDSGRDVLVAKHMATYKQNLLTSPNAFGGKGLINNSPVYYWFLAIVWFICNSLESILLFFIAIGIVNIVLSYLLFRECGNKKFSLLFALFVSTDNTFIYLSRMIWQPHLLPFFQLLSFLFLFKGVKDSKYYLWAIQFTFFAFHIHLSYIPFLGIAIIFVLIDLIKDKHYKLLLKAIFLITANIVIWFFITNNSFLTFLPSQSHGLSVLININNFFQKIILIFQRFDNNLSFWSYSDKFLFFVYSFLIVLILFCIKKEISKKKIFWLLLTMMGSFVFLGFLSMEIYSYYLYPYHFLLAFSYFFIASYFKKVGYFIIIPLLILNLTDSKMISYLYSDIPLNEKAMHKIISKKILDSNKYQTNDLEIKVCLAEKDHCSNPDGFTSSIYFFLEENLNKKLGVIANTSNGNSYVPYNLNQNNRSWFIICQYPKETCLDDLNIELSKTKEIFYEEGISIISYQKSFE